MAMVVHDFNREATEGVLNHQPKAKGSSPLLPLFVQVDFPNPFRTLSSVLQCFQDTKGQSLQCHSNLLPAYPPSARLSSTGIVSRGVL